MRGLEPEDIADLELGQPHAKGRVFPVERVGHHGAEGPVLCYRALHELQRNLGLGAEGRVGLAAGKPVRRRVGFDIERIVHALVGPQAGHGDHAVVGFAEIGEILSTDVGGLVAVFAVTGLVNDQHALLSSGALVGSVRRRSRRRLLSVWESQVELGEKPLQALCLAVLRADDGFGVGEGGERLIAFGGQEQPLQIAAERPPADCAW